MHYQVERVTTARMIYRLAMFVTHMVLLGLLALDMVRVTLFVTIFAATYIVSIAEKITADRHPFETKGEVLDWLM